ncbi:MAG: hypothetical protein V2I67_19425 [Thermoanaerobaculales bacterium]|jgi:hypothetical protein|nr:hypothetical protein [Thermoanaerobaculales bacterium]
MPYDPGIFSALDRVNRWFSTTTPGAARSEAISRLLFAAVAMIGLPVTVHATAVSGFVMGLPIGPATLPVACALFLLWLFAIAHRRFGSSAVKVFALTVLTMVVALGLAVTTVGQVYDPSHDGQWFNQEAVLLFDAGWNPLRVPALEAVATEIGARSRIDGYTKAPWIFDAAVFAVTGRIETGKVVDILLLLAAALSATAAALSFRTVPAAWAAAFGMVVAANPTAMNQITTHMVDGELGWGMAVLASGLTIMAVGPATRLATLAACLGLVWTIGTKFSGVPMALAMLVGALLIATVVDRRRITGGRVGALIVALAAAGVLNINPFLTNVLWFDHPFYPYYGAKRTNDGFAEKTSGTSSMVVSMFSSMFSHPDRYRKLGPSHRELATGRTLKVPFTMSKRDLTTMRVPGMHIGGWGPLFGGMLILALLILVAEVRSRPPPVAGAVLIAAAVVASALTIQHPWVARYVPQTWWLPLVVIPVAASSPRAITRLLGWLLVMSAVVSSSLTLGFHVSHFARESVRLEERLRRLGADGQPFAVSYDYIRSNRRRLAELGLDAREVADPRVSILVINGRRSARIRSYRFQEDGSGMRHRLVLRWKLDPDATFHRINVVPVDSARRKTTTVVRDVVAPKDRTRFLLRDGRWRVEVQGCNLLGCGPADVAELTTP